MDHLLSFLVLLLRKDSKWSSKQGTGALYLCLGSRGSFQDFFIKTLPSCRVFAFFVFMRYTQTVMLYDVVIIGASAAGVSAAVYAKRRNLSLAVVSDDIGGEVATSGEIENYLGFPQTDGIALSEKFKEQLKHNAIEVEYAHVTKIEKKDGNFVVVAKKGSSETSFETHTVIVATGVHPRELAIPGEKEFKNKGVTYCTVCDGPLFKDKTVATIGGGNSALESILMLSGIAKKVYSININKEFTGENTLIDKVKGLDNVEIITDALTTKIIGDNLVTGLEYKSQENEELKQLEVQGVFVHIGMIPNSEFIDFVKKNEFGEIEVNAVCATNVPGMFAAGDVTNIPYKQITVAAGQGTCAALSSVDYLNKLQA